MLRHVNMTVQIAPVSWLGWSLAQLQSVIISGIKAAVKRNQELAAFAAGGKTLRERERVLNAALGSLGREPGGARSAVGDPRGRGACQGPNRHPPARRGCANTERQSRGAKSCSSTRSGDPEEPSTASQRMAFPKVGMRFSTPPARPSARTFPGASAGACSPDGSFPAP